MLALGRFHFLTILRKTGRGTFLSTDSYRELFLPKGQTPEFSEVGDKIEVFLYLNSNNEQVATTHKPYVTVGQMACLEVVSVNHLGAFLNWGLPKDLFSPFGQQQQKMQVGESHIVAVYQDNTERVAASSKLNRFVELESRSMKRGQKVQALIADTTDLGCKIIVNSKYWGILHHSDIIEPVKYGETITAYIKQVRSDGRLDIGLTPIDQKIRSLQSQIISFLKKNEGFYSINDKSSPQTIYQLFSVSKKNFKATLGLLYKKQIIQFEKDGIRLNNNME
jgi:predicted RNA-binding protein (virulence factor B family)